MPLESYATKVAALAVASIAACGTPTTTGLPPEPFPDVIDFGGAYTVGHTMTASGLGRSTGCTGSAIMTNDLGISIQGSVGISGTGACAQFNNASGQLFGTIRDEVIMFSLSGLPDPFVVIGCQLSGGDPAFTGTFQTRDIGNEVVRVTSFRATRHVRATCDGQEVDAEWELRGSRTDG